MYTRSIHTEYTYAYTHASTHAQCTHTMHTHTHTHTHTHKVALGTVREKVAQIDVDTKSGKESVVKSK